MIAMILGQWGSRRSKHGLCPSAGGLGLLPFFLWGSCLFWQTAWGQSSISGQVVNGTTGRPAVNQKVELLTLGEGMNVTKESSTGNQGRFTFEQVELAPSSPHILLRTIYRGVNYNRSLSSSAEMADPQLLTIYETESQLGNIGVSMPFMIALAHGNELRIEHQYLLTNNSQPKRTLANSQSTFEFDTPASPIDLKVSVLGLGRIPLPQRPLIREGGGYRINYPMKPGINEMWVAYNVRLSGDDRQVKFRLLHGTDHSQLFVKPSTLQVTGTGVRSTGIDSRTDSATFHITRIAKGEFLNLRIVGEAPEHSAQDGHDHGDDSEFRVVRLPNRVYEQRTLILGTLAALSLAIIFYALGQQSRERFHQQGRKRKKKRP